MTKCAAMHKFHYKRLHVLVFFETWVSGTLIVECKRGITDWNLSLMGSVTMKVKTRPQHKELLFFENCDHGITELGYN